MFGDDFGFDGDLSKIYKACGGCPYTLIMSKRIKRKRK